jgi:hypothetical protein
VELCAAEWDKYITKNIEIDESSSNTPKDDLDSGVPLEGGVDNTEEESEGSNNITSRSTLVIDLDKNGYDDVVYGTIDNTKYGARAVVKILYVYEDKQEVVRIVSSESDSHFGWDIGVGDFDGDGSKDLLIIDIGAMDQAGDMRVFFGDGNGKGKPFSNELKSDDADWIIRPDPKSIFEGRFKEIKSIEWDGKKKRHVTTISRMGCVKKEPDFKWEEKLWEFTVNSNPKKNSCEKKYYETNCTKDEPCVQVYFCSKGDYDLVPLESESN